MLPAAPPITPTIRRWSSDDADALFEAVRESVDTLSPWLPWCHPDYAMADTTAWLAYSDAQWQAGAAHHFAVTSSSGALLGSVGLSEISPRYRSAHLGYWVRRSMLGHGLGAAAVGLAAGFAFRQLGLVRLEIAVLPNNLHSCRVAELAGAQLEGIARNRIVMNGKVLDARLYSLVPDAG